MAQRKSRSLTGHVYEQLRTAVLHGEFAAGERLVLDALASRYGVSLGVVREAVTRLASERLIDAIPQAGFRTRLTSTRCSVEVSLVVTESIRHGDTNWEGELVAAHHVLSITKIGRPDGTATPEWMDAHSRFHTTLAAGCPNTTMQVVRQQLFNEAELHRHQSGSGTGPPPGVVDEHQALLDTALRRDPEGTADLLISHIRSTADRAAKAMRTISDQGAQP